MTDFVIDSKRFEGILKDIKGRLLLVSQSLQAKVLSRNIP